MSGDDWRELERLAEVNANNGRNPADVCDRCGDHPKQFRSGNLLPTVSNGERYWLCPRCCDTVEQARLLRHRGVVPSDGRAGTKACHIFNELPGYRREDQE